MKQERDSVDRERLVLAAGPALRWTRLMDIEDAQAGGWVTSDVTAQAHARLFEPVELDAGLTLRDVFLLVGDDCVLRAVLHRQHVDELMALAAPSLARPRHGCAGHHAGGIECLELFRALGSDGERNEVAGFIRLDLRSVASGLREELPAGGEVLDSRGTGLCGELEQATLGDLMDLPLRLAQEVVVMENDTACDEPDREVTRFRSGEATLGEVLHGVFRGLSCFGRQTQLDELLEFLAIEDEAQDDIDVQALLQRIAKAASRHNGGSPA